MQMKNNLITIYEIRKAIVLSYYYETVEEINARIRYQKDFTKRDFTTLAEMYYNDIFDIAKVRSITSVRDFEYLANTVLAGEFILSSYILLFNCLDVTKGELCRFIRTLSNNKIKKLVDNSTTIYEYYISRISSHRSKIINSFVHMGHRKYIISRDSSFMKANENYIAFSLSHANINKELIIDFLVNEEEYL
jgi:hypothetical protein